MKTKVWKILLFLLGEVILISLLGIAFYYNFFENPTHIPIGFIVLGVGVWAVGTYFLLCEIIKKPDSENDGYNNILPPDSFT